MARPWGLASGPRRLRSYEPRTELRERKPATAVQTVREVERGSRIAGPERVTPASALAARTDDLRYGVHREGSSALEP